MRYLMIVVLVLALLPAVALAEDGHQAKFNLQFNLSPEMKAAMAQSGGDGASMDGMMPEPINGQMWWTEKNLRMEIMFPAMGPGEDPFTGVILLDIPKQEMYMLDSSTKEASKVDLTNAAQAAGAPGLMGANPTELIGDWKANIEQIKAKPGTTVKELGKVTLDGQSCQHYSFDIDTTKLQEDPSLAEDTSLAGMLGAFGGEVWVAEDTGMPIKLTTSIMGMDMVYQLTDVKTWASQASLFEVPKDYTITTMEDMLAEPATATE
jgi:hypothetical protein